MPRAFATRRSCVAGPLLALLLLAPAFARAADDAPAAPHDDSTWVDHDHQPIVRPPESEPDHWAQLFHQGFTKPITNAFDIPDKLLWLARGFGARTRREAVNVNAFDEAPNSTWFTNRNHLRAVPVSRSTLERGLRGLLGRSPHEEIRRVQLDRARQLLAETDLKLTAVAARSGLRHAQYLCEAFKARYGLTPGRYRAKHRR